MMMMSKNTMRMRRNSSILVIIFAAATIVASVSAATVPRQKRQAFPSEFDPAKVDTFLKNDDFVRSQINCVIANDDTRCSPIGRRIRTFIIDGLAANGTCPSTCTQEEKDTIAKVLKHVKVRFNPEWNQIAVKYNVPPAVLTKLEAL